MIRRAQRLVQPRSTRFSQVKKACFGEGFQLCTEVSGTQRLSRGSEEHRRPGPGVRSAGWSTCTICVHPFFAPDATGWRRFSHLPPVHTGNRGLSTWFCHAGERGTTHKREMLHQARYTPACRTVGPVWDFRGVSPQGTSTQPRPGSLEDRLSCTVTVTFRTRASTWAV